MFNGSVVPSLADIAAVTDNRNNGYGFGGEGWWVIILLFALFGWGNGGYGGNGNMTYPIDASLQRGFDTQTIIGKLDGLNSGVCSLGYDQLAQMNGINTNILQTGFGIQQGMNTISRQIDNCCCDNRAAIADLKYTIATDACALNNNVHQTGDAIIQNQTAGFNMLNQTIKDGFCNLEMREMQRENADLRQRLNNCDRDAALQGTASYIINSVRPTPIPSWNVQNPWSDCNCNVGCSRSNCSTCC